MRAKLMQIFFIANHYIAFRRHQKSDYSAENILKVSLSSQKSHNLLGFKGEWETTIFS